MAQTWPPDGIFVVDNGDGDVASQVAREVGNGKIEYRHTGSNLGPAGGVAYGMRWLVDEGFDWILINDDDNWFSRDDLLARLRTLIRKHHDDPKVGAVARTGLRWDSRRGRLLHVPDRELHGDVTVDVTGGNQHPIVRREVIETVGTFHEDLFFGRDEELFCLRMLRAGWSIVVDGDLWAETKAEKKRDGVGRTGPVKRHLNRPHAWRTYYSTRNYIAEMRRTFGRPDLARREVGRAAVRALAAWLGGPRYGVEATRMQARAVADGYRERLGKTVEPSAKPRDVRQGGVLRRSPS